MSKRARETDDEILILSDSESETGKATSAEPASRCPVSGRTSEQDLLQLHVREQSEEGQEASCSTSQGNEGTVLCSSGCGALLRPWEVADHKAAHRCLVCGSATCSAYHLLHRSPLPMCLCSHLRCLLHQATGRAIVRDVSQP